ncbi:MAG: hypothetical protein R3C26_02095 [Calditrichia bacterium]
MRDRKRPAITNGCADAPPVSDAATNPAIIAGWRSETGSRVAGKFSHRLIPGYQTTHEIFDTIGGTGKTGDGTAANWRSLPDGRLQNCREMRVAKFWRSCWCCSVAPRCATY